MSRCEVIEDDVGEEVPWRGAPLCAECAAEADQEFTEEARGEAARGC